jgi:hypothetical protein
MMQQPRPTHNLLAASTLPRISAPNLSDPQ